MAATVPGPLRKTDPRARDRLAQECAFALRLSGAAPKAVAAHSPRAADTVGGWFGGDLGNPLVLAAQLLIAIVRAGGNPEPALAQLRTVVDRETARWLSDDDVLREWHRSTVEEHEAEWRENAGVTKAMETGDPRPAIEGDRKEIAVQMRRLRLGIEAERRKLDLRMWRR